MSSGIRIIAPQPPGCLIASGAWKRDFAYLYLDMLSCSPIRVFRQRFFAFFLLALFAGTWTVVELHKAGIIFAHDTESPGHVCAHHPAPVKELPPPDSNHRGDLCPVCDFHFYTFLPTGVAVWQSAPHLSGPRQVVVREALCFAAPLPGFDVRGPPPVFAAG